MASVSPHYGTTPTRAQGGRFFHVASSEHDLHNTSNRNEDVILAEEYPEGNSTFWQAVFNFVNTIVGAGIIGLPYAVRKTGFGMGIILLCLAAYLIDQSAIMLVVAGERAKLLNYEELMGALFGEAGYHTYATFACIMAFGAMVAYLIIIGDTVPQVALACGAVESSLLADRQFIIAVLSTAVVLPVSSLRDLHNLAFASLISVASVVLIVAIVLIAAPGESARYGDSIDRSSTFVFARSSVFSGFGAVSFAFVCQSSTLIVYRSLKEGVRSVASWKRITHTSLVLAWVQTMALALIGYLSFVDVTRADILNNFSANGGLATAARAFLAVAMLLTYPMEMVVCRHTLHAAGARLLHGREGSGHQMSLLVHCIITVIIWACTTATAIATDDLGTVLEIFGAFAASVIGYVLPALLYLKSHEAELVAARQLWSKPSSSSSGGYNGSSSGTGHARLRNDSNGAVCSPHQQQSVAIVGADSATYEGATLGAKLGAVRPFFTAVFMAAFGLVTCIAGTVSVLVSAAKKSGVGPPVP